MGREKGLGPETETRVYVLSYPGELLITYVERGTRVGRNRERERKRKYRTKER